MIFKFS